MKESLSVVVRAVVEGFHYWPQAPVEVAYLRGLHHHFFTVVVEVSVAHTEREVEFHLLRQHVIEVTNRVFTEAGSTASCETYASRIGAVLSSEGFQPARVEVWEDEWVGGIWRRI